MSADDSFAAEYPLEAGADDPAARLTMHAVVVRGDDAFFDEGAAQGFLQLEAGMTRADRRDELAAAEEWHIVWVAAAHRADGARGYSGLTITPFWLDEAARRYYRDDAAERERRAAALSGAVDIDALGADARSALARALVTHDPDAFDEASGAVRAAFAHVELA